MSFKYGDFSGLRNGRYYNDFKTRSMKDLLSRHKELSILEIWKTHDVRTDRVNDFWLNDLLKKNNNNKQKQ